MENNNVPGLDAKTTKTILITSGILVAWSAFSSFLAIGPITASIITYSLYAFYWFYAVHYKNPLILRLVIIGTIAGILELYTDHYLVDTINSLVYPKSEWMIWSSPAYMPFAWSNVILQLSFVGVLLTKKFNIWKASIILCLLGGMYIPLYEHLARNAGWWWYNDNTPMIFNAPIYVIVCEGLISLSLPVIVDFSENNKLGKTFVLGVVEGVWIYVAALLSFAIAG
ncbi:DUF6989 domain-containing protein [Reichenbachiella versicolor]|uniref:DUF6989 domain-containing protein n=1 Tax=Reichenbachiella versicolor TaxID=1821036 RepID=UPI000D6DE772|nr:hypothetical protein [Reichenbachiella versicolor]